MIFKKWGKWNNLTIGEWHYCIYLVQARKRSDGKIQFRLERQDGVFAGEEPTMEQINTLSDD